MTPTVLRYSTIVVALLFSRIAASDECVNVSFAGVDAQLQNAAYKQIATELNVPVHRGEGPAECWHLSIELRDATSRILLSRQNTYSTTIQLDEFDPALWSRALALSSSGLWILAHEHPELSRQGNPVNGRQEQQQDTVAPLPESKREAAPSSRQTRTISVNRKNRLHAGADNSRAHFLFHTASGGRMLTSSRTGIFDFSMGMSVLAARLRFDLSLVGIYGRKSFNAGQIYTTGAGLRAALFWQTNALKKTILGIGPSIEAFGIFGYGHSNEDFDAHQAFTPVVNMMLMGGGWLSVSPKVTAHIALGGGYSLVHFEQQIDRKTVAGFSGASINVLVGASFGRASGDRNN